MFMCFSKFPNHLIFVCNNDFVISFWFLKFHSSISFEEELVEISLVNKMYKMIEYNTATIGRLQKRPQMSF